MMKHMTKRLLCAVLCLILCCQLLPAVAFAAEIVANGTSGVAQWSLDTEGIFTISGGAMENYTEASEQPWYSYADLITKVVIGDGVTRVGDYAFDGCDNLTEVEVGSSVHAIGKYAFANTPALGTVVFPKNVTVLSEGLFYKSGLDALYIYNRKTEFDGYWNIEDSISKSATVYCYPNSHFDHYSGDGQTRIMLTDDPVMNIDQGNSSVRMDSNHPNYVRNLWAAADTADGLVFDYSVSMHNDDIIRIHNEIAEDNRQVGADENNNSKLELEVQVELRRDEGDGITSIRGSATYALCENDLEFSPNKYFNEWGCWTMDGQDFLKISASGETITVNLNATMQELEAYAGEPIGYVWVYIAVKGQTHYRSGRYEYENFPTTAESIGFSIYDAHQRESTIEECGWMMTLDQELVVEDFAPNNGYISASEYANYLEPVSRHYTWEYSFSRGTHIYNEETDETVIPGDCFWLTEDDGVITEWYNGILYGGVRGSYDAGDDASVSIRQMLSEEELAFVETLRGVESTGSGGEVFIDLRYTLLLTYEDGSVVTLHGGVADETTSIAGVCLHTCSICGLCTSEKTLACNVTNGWRTNECTCQTPSPYIQAITVGNADVLDSYVYSGEVTAIVETVDWDGVDVATVFTTDYFKAIVNSIGSGNIAALFDITLFNQWGDVCEINDWEGAEEYVTLAIPVSAEIAAAAANGELELYHVDINGVTEKVEFTVDTVNHTITFTGTAFSPYVLAQEAGMYGRNLLKTMPNSAALLYAYDQIAAGVENVQQNISIYDGVNPISLAETQLVMHLFRKDYGGAFWLDSQWGMSHNSTTATNVQLQYVMTGAELETAQAAFEAEAQKILSGLTPGMTEYEKVLYIHDALAAVVEYVDGPNAHNAYGALVEGKAVCEGYAEALQYLLQRAGIQCFAAVGSSINPGTGVGEPHKWNYVRIDGKYYHVDLTWNDQGEELYHAYFGVTDAVIQEDHYISSVTYTLPTCNATDAFYFEGKPEKLDTYTVDSVGQLMKDNGNKVHVYVSGDTDAFTQWFKDNVIEIAQKAGVDYPFAYTYSWLGREYILEFVNVASGSTVQGTVSSFGAGVAVTVELYQGNTLMHTAQVTGNAATYSIGDVKDGTYTMRVTKDQHHIYETEVTVSGADVTQNVQIWLKGDINSDGNVNNKDIVRLFQYLSDWPVEVNPELVDVNGDGNVNNKDAVRLFQYLSDWPVEIF